MSFISTPDWQEKKGRAEDGPVDTKKKFSEWPGKHAQGGQKASGKKTTSVKSSGKSTGTTGGKSSGSSSSGKGK